MSLLTLLMTTTGAPVETFTAVPWVGTNKYRGDSITEGSAASDAAHRYVNLVASGTGTSLINQGESGTGIRDAIKQGFSDDETVNTTHGLSIATGTNDLRNSNSSSKQNKLKEGMRVVLANHFLGAFTPIDDAAIVQTGTWSDLTDSNISSKSVITGTGTPIKSSVAGSKLTFTHTGRTLVIGTWGVDAAHTSFGSFNVKVNGILKATYDAKDKADDWYYSAADTFDIRMPNVVVISGLPSSSHTVVIEVLENKEVDFDYVGTLRDPESSESALVWHVLKSSGYTFGGIYSSDAVVEASWAAYDEVVEQFNALGFPVVAVPAEDFFNPVNTADTLHPNDTGMAQIAAAGLSVITL